MEESTKNAIVLYTGKPNQSKKKNNSSFHKKGNSHGHVHGLDKKFNTNSKKSFLEKKITKNNETKSVNVNMKTNPHCNKVWDKLSNSVKYHYEKNISNGHNISEDMIEKYTYYFRFIMLNTNNIITNVSGKDNILISSIVNISNKLKKNEVALIFLIKNFNNKKIVICCKNKTNTYDLDEVDILSKDSLEKDDIKYKMSIVVNNTKIKSIIFESKRERNSFLYLLKKKSFEYN